MEGLEELPAADLLGFLNADTHGCAIARSVRENGRIIDFELVYLNDAGCAFLGRPREELVGRRYRQLWPETVDDDTLPLYRRVVHTRERAVRTVYYDRSSVAGHFEVRLFPCGDGFIAQFVDMTKLTLGLQTEGGARLYEALDAAFDGFVLLRAVRHDTGVIVDFVCEYVNQIGAKLVGRTVEEVIGQAVRDRSPATLEYRLFDRYRQVAEDGAPWRQQLTSPATGQVWELKVARVDSDTVAVSYRDVTEQVDQQEQLGRSVEQARVAAERTATLQAVTAALVAANTPAEVYAAIDTVVRPSAGGRGIVVLLRKQDRLELCYHAGYETEVVEQLRELPLTHPYPATEVAATGRPRYLRTPAEFAAAQPDPRTAISGGGRRAWAFLPLTTAGQVLGALVVGYTEPREFDTAEQANLVTVSRLSAQALQRALLFEAQSSIAADLQRALLPRSLPYLAGARYAVRYLPWTLGTDVGGDWYDVIPLSADTAAVVIGDVAGHSPHAAATMGQLRNAIRAYAADRHSPTAVMDRVNQLLLRLEPDAMATCCYLELHLGDGTATAVLAGHPPPVLHADGHAQPLRLRVGPPLGVAETVRYLDTSFLLPAGGDLLLYTDGLVEDRRYDLDRGLTELCAAIQTAPNPDPDTFIDHILTADVGPHPRSDDVALLALTLNTAPQPQPATAQRHFRGEAPTAATARRFTADILTAWGQHPLIDDACLLLDELLTNAIVHTTGDVAVRLTLDSRLRIEVTDSSDRPPTKRPIHTDSEIGRGLHLVDQIAHDWGHDPLPGSGKTVWFTLDTTTPPQRSNR